MILITENQPNTSVDIPANPTAKKLRCLASRKIARIHRIVAINSNIATTTEIPPSICIYPLQ